MALSGGYDDLVAVEDARARRCCAELLAAAIANQAHHHPELIRKVGDFIEKQSQLVGLQLPHLATERGFSIAAARRKRVSDCLRIIVQFVIALLAIGAVVAIGVMFIDARLEHGIRMETLSVPPDLAANGLTGQVIAKQILTRLGGLERATDTVRARGKYTKDWGADIKLEIPETGVSIGEASHSIHEWFGHATRVGGEVYRTPTGITVVIRVGDDAIEASGAEMNLQKVVEEAATRVYAWTQPYRYGYWLASTGYTKDSNAVYQRLIDDGPEAERIWGLHGIATNALSPREQISVESRVLIIDPHFLLASQRIAELGEMIGHDEDALTRSGRMLEHEDEFLTSEISPEGLAELRFRTAIVHDEEIGDFQDAVAHASNGEMTVSHPKRDFYELKKANALAHLHDIQKASEIIAKLPVFDVNSVRGFLRNEVETVLSFEQQDWEAAVTMTACTRPATLSEKNVELCMGHMAAIVAEAYGRMNRISDADAMMALIPPDVYDGWRARGRAATLRHDYEGGAAAFKEAIRQAPLVPRAYNDWGDMLLAQGNLSEAISKYAEANRLGPHWADPLKGWGDVLAKQGKWREAITKYDQALNYAPSWVALKDARKAAQSKS